MQRQLSDPDSAAQSDLPWALESDLSLGGLRCGGRLIIGADRISAASNEPAAPELSISVAEVAEYRLSPCIGCGILQARWRGDWIDLARFTNRHARRFEAVVQRLEAWRTGHIPSPAPDEPLEPPRCDRCDLPLERDHARCPRCVPRRATWSRVRELLRPLRCGIWTLTLLTFIGVAADLAPPKLQQYLVDRVLAQDALAAATPITNRDLTIALTVIVAGLAVSRFAVMLVGIFKGWLATRLGASLTASLRSQLVEKLGRFAIVYYDRRVAAQPSGPRQ
jgi:hypothetical protein